MKKLARYLKPFAGTLALALVLLFVQASLDLNLPARQKLEKYVIPVGIQIFWVMCVIQIPGNGKKTGVLV